MATSDQLRNLLQSYTRGDDEQCLIIWAQIAEKVKRTGQVKLADDLLEMLKTKRVKVPIRVTYPKMRLAHIVLHEAVTGAIEQVMAEYRQRDKLRSYGLSASRKLFLLGPTGCGKSLTASVLADELQMPLIKVVPGSDLHFMFQEMTWCRGVYLFDNVGDDLHLFSAFLEADDSDSLILVESSFEALLDSTTARHFDDVIRYGLPDTDQIERLVKNQLNVYQLDEIEWNLIFAAATGLSHADVCVACRNAAKAAVLQGSKVITTDSLIRCLKARAHMI